MKKILFFMCGLSMAGGACFGSASSFDFKLFVPRSRWNQTIASQQAGLSLQSTSIIRDAWIFVPAKTFASKHSGIEGSRDFFKSDLAAGLPLGTRVQYTMHDGTSKIYEKTKENRSSTDWTQYAEPRSATAAGRGPRRRRPTGGGVGTPVVAPTAPGDAGRGGAAGSDLAGSYASAQAVGKPIESSYALGRHQLNDANDGRPPRVDRDVAPAAAFAPVGTPVGAGLLPGDGGVPGSGLGVVATVAAPAAGSSTSSVSPKSINVRTPRQKAGLGLGGMGAGIAAGSLLYTVIQSVKTKERRRLMRIAMDRIFGGSLEPLSKREERIIRSLYRDLGIGAAGVVAGATGAGVGAWMHRNK